MATKLLLVEDVEDLGRSGDIVSVREGYARNFLLPEGFAVRADANALRRQTMLQEARKQKAIQDQGEAEALAKVLEPIAVNVEVKVDPEGNMYGSVSAHDIVNYLNEQHGIQLVKRFVQLKHPIRELGTHRVDLKLLEGVPASITLHVTSEGGHFEAAALEAAKKAAAKEAAAAAKAAVKEAPQE